MPALLMRGLLRSSHFDKGTGKIFRETMSKDHFVDFGLFFCQLKVFNFNLFIKFGWQSLSLITDKIFTWKTCLIKCTLFTSSPA